MTVTIGNVEFDHHTYDAEADVLYLRLGDNRLAASTHATPEGHAIRYNDEGQIVGMIIVNAKWLLERDGHLKITYEVPPEALAEALTPA
jgi:YD repeat-containing protein